MKSKKTRLVVDVPLHIKRMINRVQNEAQETMLAFTEALSLLEMSQDPQYAALMETQPLTPPEMHQIADMLIEHWQSFMQSMDALQQRTRRWGDPTELELSDDQEDEQEDDEPLEIELDLDLQPSFQSSDLP